MAKSIASDRGRVSAQKHEVSYAGRKVRGGTAAVKKAKKALGRTTSRKKVMARARKSR